MFGIFDLKEDWEYHLQIFYSRFFYRTLYFLPISICIAVKTYLRINTKIFSLLSEVAQISFGKAPYIFRTWLSPSNVPLFSKIVIQTSPDNDMTVTWRRHDNDMTMTWQWHDNDMEMTWQWHGNDMTMTWQWHEPWVGKYSMYICWTGSSIEKKVFFF